MTKAPAITIAAKAAKIRNSSALSVRHPHRFLPSVFVAHAAVVVGDGSHSLPLYRHQSGAVYSRLMDVLRNEVTPLTLVHLCEQISVRVIELSGYRQF